MGTAIFIIVVSLITFWLIIFLSIWINSALGVTPPPSPDDPVLSINNPYTSWHKPHWYDKIFWRYGYIQTGPHNQPVARKNKIFNWTYVRYYNTLFHYWCWVETYNHWGAKFIKNKYWKPKPKNERPMKTHPNHDGEEFTRFLEYEIFNSGWVWHFIPGSWSAKYFAKHTLKKYTQYLKSIELKNRLNIE